MKKITVFALAIVVAVSALVTGCARKVEKDWVPTGGSRADATIELSFEYNPETEIPVQNEQQGLDLAIARCQSWGYRSAEPFGGHKTICTRTMPGAFGQTCYREMVTKQYQCLGRGSEVAK